jgi:oligoribonuclease NrnB/cAMP/cGMP phosphodiesterase (DHH superfamily)
MIVYYHHDLDGECSAAIIRKVANEKKFPVMLVPMKHNVPLDIFPIKDEAIFIVDFTFTPAMLDKVLDITTDITWIDHHKTAINRYSPLAGLRDVNFSACELTWKYIHGSTPMPKAVELIGDMDKWAWKYKETMPFVEGLRQYNTDPSNLLWDSLLFTDTNANASLLFTGKSNLVTSALVHAICDQGEVCVRYRDSICKQYANDYGYECEFDGYKTFAVGLNMFGSLAFGDKVSKYDICATFEFDGVNWLIGLYSAKIDVGEIALKYGGGGHVGSSGFSCNNLPFKK